MTLESSEERMKAQSKRYWRESEDLLPWLRKGIIGDTFALKLFPYLGPDKDLLEIGPGNGRILASLQKLGGEYASYLGLDIGVHKMKFLKQTFEDDKHRFILCDAEEHAFEKRFDLIFSSATFKHLYPSFSKIIRNLATAMKPNSILISDFLEGDGTLRHPPFTRRYNRDRLTVIFEENGFQVLKFDHVNHWGAPGRFASAGGKRLLVAAKLKNSDEAG